jgi:hypothetical protein
MSNVIQFPTKTDYTGKIISVSPETPLSRFQCRGFVVFKSNPQVVGPNADMDAIQVALLDGRLLELAPGVATKTKNVSLNPAGELGDTDKKIFTLQTKEGRIVITTESAEQSMAIEKELKETGQLDLSHFPDLHKSKAVVPHLSAITITDLEPEKPNE